MLSILEIIFFVDIEKVECTYSNIAEVQKAIQEIEMKTNAKFSVYFAQGNFDKQGIYICLFMYQSVCLFICLSIYISIYLWT